MPARTLLFNEGRKREDFGLSATTSAAPFLPFEADSAFDDLRSLMGSERPPLVLIGAGASVASGYPAWPELIAKLRELALRHDKTDWRRAVEDTSDAPWTAELFASRLVPGALQRFIHRSYKSRLRLAEPHLSLARMRFPHYLTTNYDPSVEEALQKAGRPFKRIVWPCGGEDSDDQRDHEELSDFLIGLGRRDAECRVVYLHGRFDSREERLVLTESSYVARYIASDDARRKLMAIFMTHPVLFVGFSMNDPDLSNLMREVTARLRSRTPCHYAIMSYKNIADREAIRARMMGKFGVRPVFFSRTPVIEGGDEYSNLLLLLDALAGVEGQDRLLGAGPRSQETSAASPPDADDPLKGRFGGSPEVNGRRLSVIRKNGSKEAGYLNLQFVVEALPGHEPLRDRVTFYLHPTFAEDRVDRTIRAGRATLSRWAYGAFTLGAVTDAGATRLELDLAEQPVLPLWFRQR